MRSKHFLFIQWVLGPGQLLTNSIRYDIPQVIGEVMLLGRDLFPFGLLFQPHASSNHLGYNHSGLTDAAVSLRNLTTRTLEIFHVIADSK